MAKVIEFRGKESKILIDDNVTFFTNLYFKHMRMYCKVERMRFCLFRSFILSFLSKLIDDDKSCIADACRCLYQ